MDWCIFAVQNGREAIVWSALGAVGALGLLAMLSPGRFSAISARGSHWVDTNRLLAQLDKRIEVDHYILPHARLLGLAVVVSAAILAWTFARYF